MLLGVLSVVQHVCCLRMDYVGLDRHGHDRIADSLTGISTADDVWRLGAAKYHVVGSECCAMPS